ncbi:hypothetical protein [Microbacterium sp. E-13]|uniref:hypothetical protein n=1 Tax=Microbacterium sp. E-13 TaxID=3404048 RepID=UPI003CF20C46
MRRLRIQIIFGVLVVLAGILLLLEATGVLSVPSVLWATILVLASATFAWVYAADRASWWAAIPSAALLGAAIVTLLEMDPGGPGQWTEVPFLAVLSLGFWAVYLRDPRHWWALIPAGMLLTVSVVTGVTATMSGAVTGAIFLTGAAVTFALVAVLPGGASRRWWAWIPAGVLAIGAIAVLLRAAEWITLLNALWPMALIVAGGILIWRALERRRMEDRRGPRRPAESSPEQPADRPATHEV